MVGWILGLENDGGVDQQGLEDDGGMDQQGLEDDVAGEEAQEGRKEGGWKGGGRIGGRRKGGARVRFAAQAVVLNAALEGELELLKQCVQEVRV